ncbi:DUF1127 domain-containing protein [Telmatospirillum sp. J64-1]|uniref:DUF1127 domain-containing protein n=1 Tax=Telmatospirillum sp. J64-1 TaxID=2502183 RepID=UPI001C8F34A8|nr:DUF1127 domain-containing protein [Telmatospirillum sp. J64-1]
MSTFVHPSYEEIEATLRKAHHMRAAFFAKMVKTGVVKTGAFFAAIFGVINEALEMRAMTNRLMSLSDRELADMGLSRDDIGSVVNSHFNGSKREDDKAGYATANDDKPSTRTDIAA